MILVHLDSFQSGLKVGDVVGEGDVVGAQLNGKVSEATINEILRRNKVRPLDTKEEVTPK